MTVIATDTQRYSNLVKLEFMPEKGYCKKMVTYNGTAVATPIGTVLGSYIASPVGTAGAIVGTGNGAMGAITLTSNKDMVLGTYTVKIIKTVANAGDFVLLDPNGKVVGKGEVATAFNQAGFAFTLADGATDFVAGDYIPIVVTGTVKYKLVEATATDGTEVAKVIVAGDSTGSTLSTTPVVNTDTSFLVLYRGPCYVADSALSYGATVNTAAEIAALEAQLAAVGIDVLDQL